MSAALTARFLDYAASGLNDGTSEANAWEAWADADGGLTDGQKLWIKANPADARQSLTGEGNIDFSGITNSTGIEFETYTSTIGDKGVAKFDLADSVQTLKWPAGGSIVEGLDFENSGNLGKWLSPAGTFIRCRHKTNTLLTIAGVHLFCHYTGAGNNHTAVKLGSANQGALAHGCLLEHEGVSGTNNIVEHDSFGSSLSITRSILKGVGSATTRGIFLERMNDSDNVFIRENIFYKLNDAIVMDEKGDAAVGAEQLFIARNIFDTIAAFILNETSSTVGDDFSARIIDNWYRAVTSGVNNIPGATERDNVLLTADPFDAAGSDDFDLNDTAGGGTVLRAAGLPINMAYDWTNAMVPRATFEGGGAGGGEGPLVRSRLVA